MNRLLDPPQLRLTRLGGQQGGGAENSAAFEEADAAYQAQIGGGDGDEPQRCAVPGGEVSGELAAQIQTCAASLAVHQSALEAARTVYAG
jgi:hypothetical protein